MQQIPDGQFEERAVFSPRIAHVMKVCLRHDFSVKTTNRSVNPRRAAKVVFLSESHLSLRRGAIEWQGRPAPEAALTA
jgi:hypothetical protein